MTRRARWAVPIAIATVLAVAGTAYAAITISPSSPATAGQKVGGNYTWNYGNSLEKSTCGDTTYLNALYATDFVKGEYASDSGPYQGAYTTRANIANSPLNWNAPKRVNPGTQHAERTTLAADGNDVYYGYVSQVSYDNYDPAARRVFYVRTSHDCGATFSAPVRVSPGTGRVDYPILAADNGVAYAIWVNGANGNVQFAKSTNSGATWPATTIGATTSRNPDDIAEGYYGYPTVAASGVNVAIGWFTDNAGRQVIRGSSNSGTSFGPEVVATATSPNDTVHYMTGGGQEDGNNDRVALAYTSNTGVHVRVWDGSWGGQQTVESYGSTIGGTTFSGSYGPAPIPYGANSIMVVYPNCQATAQTANDCDYSLNKVRTSLVLEDSVTGTFGDSNPRVLASSVTDRYLNDSASIVTNGNTRYVLYNGWTANYFNYRLFMKLASGTGPS